MVDIRTSQDTGGAVIALELEQLHREQERLQRLYPYLKSAPALRHLFMAELAALNLRADRLDAYLGPCGEYSA